MLGQVAPALPFFRPGAASCLLADVVSLWRKGRKKKKPDQAFSQFRKKKSKTLLRKTDPEVLYEYIFFLDTLVDFMYLY